MPDELKCKLGKRIKKLREMKGLSQRELAAKVAKLKKTRTSNATISEVENGKRNLTIESLSYIARSLEVKVEYLFKFDDLEQETPNILKEIHSEFNQIPEFIIEIFTFLYNLGLRFEDKNDYLYLWFFIKTLMQKNE